MNHLLPHLWFYAIESPFDSRTSPFGPFDFAGLHGFDPSNGDLDYSVGRSVDCPGYLSTAYSFWSLGSLDYLARRNGACPRLTRESLDSLLGSFL